MPTYEYECPCGHRTEDFCHSWRNRQDYVPCGTCGETAQHIITVANPSLFFEEGGGGRMIENLGPEPVMVTSPKQHRELMKKQGVTWATKGQGQKGCWI